MTPAAGCAPTVELQPMFFLDLVIGSGADATVRLIYLAPYGCIIAWSNDVHPVAAREGRRPVQTPAFTVRLVPLVTPDCDECLRAV